MEDWIAEAAAPRATLGLTDRLQVLQQKVREVRDLEAEIRDLEERTKAAQDRLTIIKSSELVDLMDEAGVDHVGLPAEGNHPAYDAKTVPYYSANIAAGWDHDRRKRALACLDGSGHGDLIKTVITIPMSRERRKEAIELVRQLREQNLACTVTETVHPMTLTAWLKYQVEYGKKLPPLDVIGATIGRTVKIKERKP